MYPQWNEYVLRRIHPEQQVSELPPTKCSQWTTVNYNMENFPLSAKIIRWNPFVCSDRLEKWQFL